MIHDSWIVIGTGRTAWGDSAAHYAARHGTVCMLRLYYMLRFITSYSHLMVRFSLLPLACSGLSSYSHLHAQVYYTTFFSKAFTHLSMLKQACKP